jgi:hypothetical protein
LRMTAVVDDLDDLAGPRRHQQQQMLEAIAAYGPLARQSGTRQGRVGTRRPWSSAQ